MKRKFGDFLRISTTLYQHLFQIELQNLGISTYLYTELLIRPVYVSQAEKKARLLFPAIWPFSNITKATHCSQFLHVTCN